MEKNYESGERILVCLSSSPSNQKVINAAVKMTEAFHAVLTAIYVKPSNYDSLPESDKIRLQNNIKFAEQNGRHYENRGRPEWCKKAALLEQGFSDRTDHSECAGRGCLYHTGFFSGYKATNPKT